MAAEDEEAPPLALRAAEEAGAERSRVSCAAFARRDEGARRLGAAAA